MKLRTMKLLGSLLLGSSLLLGACTKHNPDSILNPESDLYVGDEAAAKDANGNGIADVLEGPQCAAGDLVCGEAQAALSQTALSSLDAASSASSAANVPTSSNAISSSSAVALECLVGETKLVGVGAKEMTSGETSVCAQVDQQFFFVPNLAAGQSFTQWSSLPAGLTLVTGGQSEPSIKVRVTSVNTPVLEITALLSNAGGSSSSQGAPSSASTMATNTGETGMLDNRDQQAYVTKRIGSLIWMTTNLAYNPGGNSTCASVSGSTIALSTTEANCKANGRYYTNAVAASTGLCPGGWRLPTAPEYVDAHTNLDLKNTGVVRAAGNLDIANTGFYWTLSTYAQMDGVDGVQKHCYNAATCGVAYISHEDAAINPQYYIQINDAPEAMPVRCVREP